LHHGTLAIDENDGPDLCDMLSAQPTCGEHRTTARKVRHSFFKKYSLVIKP